MQLEALAAARIWLEAGCSVVPAQHGKRPLGEWKQYMTERPTLGQLSSWYSTNTTLGVGLICGKVSGNLEMLELEGRATTSQCLDKVAAACAQREIEWLWSFLLNEGYVEATPSGGLHLLYRIMDHPVPPNSKVARRLATPEELAAKPDDKIKTLSETRGEGGFVVVAPSDGIHPEGGSWSVLTGQLGRIPMVAWKHRCLLHEAIKAALDEMPPEQQWERPAAPANLLPLDSSRPGDDFQQRVTWAEILEPHGWRVHHQTVAETFWTRPGKKRVDGWSATTGLMGTGRDDRLYVWSSSTPFDPERPYNKFAAYALLEHNGDFAAAARELRRRGFGSPATPSAPPVVGTLEIPAQAVPADQQLVSVPVPPSPAPQPQQQPQAVERNALGLPVLDPKIFEHVGWDQHSLATLWVQAHTSTFAYVAADKEWRMWNGRNWVTDEHLRHEHATNRMMATFLEYARALERSGDDRGKAAVTEARKLVHSREIQALLRKVRSDPRVAASHGDFDKDPNLMTVRNGTLNLATLELTPHDPANLLTRVVNAKYQPDAPTGRWDRFVEEVLPDAEVRAYVQRLCGYAMLGQPTERVMAIMYGPSGSGKTQFLEAIKDVLGDFAAIAPRSAFEPRLHGYKGPSDELHKLMGKRFVIQSELDASTRLNEALVKSIVGADAQTTRPLYGKYVDWRPEYTLFMATNFLPRINSSDNAIWNRVKPVKFDRVFVDEKGEALSGEDKGLGPRMARENPEEILNWLIEGLLAYREKGLREPQQVGEWLQEYRDDVDTTRQFLTEAPEDGQIVVEEKAQVGVRQLYRAYVGWCTDNEMKPLGLKTFNERMRSNGWETKKRDKGVMWQGVGLAGELVAAQKPSFYPRQ